MTEQEALKAEIHGPWAFTKDEVIKAQHNIEVYAAIKHLAKATHINSSYASSRYKVTETTDIKLTNDQRALIADDGNLCYGYGTENDIIVIYTD